MGDSSKDPGPIPNRWLNCPRKGIDLIAKKFLVLKTPLSTKFDGVVPEASRFSPTMILKMQQFKDKIGLWINLTNTARFYHDEEIKSEGIKYVKLPCRGHGEAPSLEQKDGFVALVHTYISKYPLKLIAVHCTHGFNRTGFLIVSYLVEKYDCSLESALNQFSRVRPPGIYKGDYIEELYRRYDDFKDTPPPPELPKWCLEYDDEPENSESVDSDSKGLNQKGRRKPVKFMEGVSGVYQFTEQPKAFHLQKKIRDFCGWKGKEFPGSQPVSMDRMNISLLNTKPYKVSWKADGMRYMMLIVKQNEIYFFDRDNNPFKVQGIVFVHSKNLQQHLTDTLLDGEMVIDQVNGQAIPRFLIYDIVRFETVDVGKQPFPSRLRIIQKEIIQPRHTAITKGLINKTIEPFSIRQKEFWDLTHAASLLSDKFSKMLSHEPDGLIFQPSNDPYVAGRCDSVLKWKPLHMNSVDFRLKIVTEGGQGILPKKVGHLYVGPQDQLFARIKVTKTLKEFHNKIIECKFENDSWVFMRERTDKSFPNSITTAKGVCESIMNPVTKDSLLCYIDKHRFIEDPFKVPSLPKRSRLDDGTL